MKEFEPLIGEWHGEGEVPIEPPMKISVEATIERLGKFIVLRSISEPSEVPDNVSIIGGAPDGEPQPMHYFDARGVERLYLMALDGTTWKIWRAPGEDWNGPHGPGFNQRFIGEISADGKRIEGRWERGMGTPATCGRSTSRSTIPASRRTPCEASVVARPSEVDWGSSTYSTTAGRRVGEPVRGRTPRDGRSWSASSRAAGRRMTLTACDGSRGRCRPEPTDTGVRRVGLVAVRAGTAGSGL
jgi:hypothetical protein